MPRGRPVKGPKLVDNLDGSQAAKRKLELVLETVTGKTSIQEACLALGIGKSAFHKLRSAMLQTALERLEPRPSGRPPREQSNDQDRVTELENEVELLRMQLEIAHVREEIMLCMPDVLETTEPPPKKKARTSSRAKRKRKRKRKKK
jgi:transposase-like protein